MTDNIKAIRDAPADCSAGRPCTGCPSKKQCGQTGCARQSEFRVPKPRYRVEKTKNGFWPYVVKCGGGASELFKGHKTSCDRVASQLNTAYQDGLFVGSGQYAACNPAAITELLARLEAAEGDSQRLDWLESRTEQHGLVI